MSVGRTSTFLDIFIERDLRNGIITESEALSIQQALGVDPHNPADVAKMMNKYFLLAFGIYDTENKLLDIMYDGESQFSTESIRELAAKNKKDTNLLSMNQY